MDLLNHLGTRAKLYLLMAIFIIGFIIYGILSYYTIQTVRIKGSFYNEIVLSKDLVADILPPPEYLVETYLLIFQQAMADNPNEIEQLTQRIRSLHNEYLTRHNYWSEVLPKGQLRDVFLNQSYLPAVELFNIWEKEFLPALQNGDRNRAINLLRGSLNQNYQEHRKAIDETIVLARKLNEDTEQEADHLYRTATDLAIATWLATVLIGSLLAYWIARSITQRLHDIINEIFSIAKEINSKMDVQSQNVVQQYTSVHETTTTMDELNTSFQHTASLANESSRQAKNAQEVSKEANTILKQMLEGLTEHKNKVGEIVRQIMKLGELTHQIHNIANVTSNLTTQTNILALNAAVQTAQNKQYNEGFSVIATEIRRLADESKKFLAQIDLLVENIQQATDSTMMIAEQGSGTVQETIQRAQSTLKAFEQISDVILNTNESAQLVSSNVEQQALAVRQVLEAMELLNQSAQQTVEATNQVKHALHQLNKVSTDINKVI